MDKNLLEKERYNKLVSRIVKRYPKARIKCKKNHWFWSKCPKTLRLSATTLGNTIWMPSRTPDFGKLAHEYQHLVDYNEIGFWGFMYMYTQPQNVALWFMFFAIMALGFGSLGFSIAASIGAILCLLPWPSKSRAYLEMKGYAMSIYVRAEQGEAIEESKHFVVDALRSWLYYKMVWTKLEAISLVDETIELMRVRECIPYMGIAFKDVYEIINETKKTII